MLFVSPVFIFMFLPIVFAVHYFLDPKYKNAFLALSSFIFYAWGGLQYALLILLSTIVNYILGRVLGVSQRSNTKRIYLVVAIVYNIGILAFFKYFNFIVDNIEKIINMFNPNFVIQAPLIPLPVGISFFTFQILSYVIDVYRGNVKEQKSFINLSLYIMLFPQLIAGPIVRYIDVEKQISIRQITLSKTKQGIERFIIGFAKKLLIANAMGLIADYFFDNPVNQSTLGAWIGVLAYSLQIYYDFSAYSDMAIGLGKILGFDFHENFNYPYISKSIKEFWRRWHISLSSWFRDYVYIPLGGNRKSTARTYLNLLIVFFVTGLWHGASWNFVAWGLFHGMFLVIERLGFSNILNKIPKPIRHLYTLIVVMVGWVLFRSATLTEAISYISNMFVYTNQFASRVLLILDNKAVIMFILAIIFSCPIYKKIKEFNNKIKAAQIVYEIILLIIFVISILYMTGSSFNPFIYFIF